MSRMRWLRLLALTVVPVLLLTACPAEEEEPEPEPTDTAEPDEDEDEDEVTRDDGVLRLGYVLPETGDLADIGLGEPQIAAVQYAVSVINDAGGVLGNDVTLDGGDEAGDSAIASETADGLLQDGVDAIVGAAATGMTLAIVDQVTGAGVVQCSGSNTGPIMTDYPDDGFYFRTAPTDALQGPILADLIVGDENSEVAIIARGDEYGEGLLEATRDALQEQGATVTDEIIYDPNASTFDSEVEELAASDPQAVLVIAFAEGAQIVQTMTEAGLGAQDIALYGADGLAGSTLAGDVDPENPNVVDGLTGTRPDTSVDPAFQEALQEFEPDLEDVTFAPQVFDCAIVVALAAVAADSDDPAVFVDEIVNVTRDGEACATFEECVALLEDGEDIDYEGPSGSTTFTDVGEPDVGIYEVWGWRDGEFVSIEAGIEQRLE